MKEQKEEQEISDSSEVWCVWYSEYYAESLACDDSYEFEKCLTNKKLLAIFKNDEDAEKFQQSLSSHFVRNCFISLETIN